jgi:hypothetical protein
MFAKPVVSSCLESHKPDLHDPATVVAYPLMNRNSLPLQEPKGCISFVYLIRL